MMDLGEQLGECLAQVVSAGFAFPIYVACVATNGTHAFVKFDGNEAEFVVEPTGNFTLPINLMFTDASGEAAREVIDKDGIVH